MSDTGGASSNINSKKMNSSASSNKKRTLSDAGLDDTTESDSQNIGKRIVVFEPFKLVDVQSAVSFLNIILKNIFVFDVLLRLFFCFVFRKNSMQNFY